VQKIGGPIQWIDEPLIVVLTGLCAAFFGQDAVVGVGLVQYLNNIPFRLYVRLTHEIITLFLSHIEPFKMVKMAEQDATGAQGGAFGDSQNWMHGVPGSVEKHELPECPV
jgi:hypothetical protein